MIVLFHQIFSLILPFTSKNQARENTEERVTVTRKDMNFLTIHHNRTWIHGFIETTSTSSHYDHHIFPQLQESKKKKKIRF